MRNTSILKVKIGGVERAFPLPAGWAVTTLREILPGQSDGKQLHQGWSPRCETYASSSDLEWGVLKTTAIQNGKFLSKHNKQLPAALSPRQRIEVKSGDLLITCAGPRSRCGIPCHVKKTRPRLMMSGKMYRFRAPEGIVSAAYLEGWLQTPLAQKMIDGMKTGISDSGLNLTHGRFLELQVPIAPILEQYRIAASFESLLSRIDDAMTTLERVQGNLKRYRASVLKSAVEGSLVSTEAELAEVEGLDYEPASALLKRILAERRLNWEKAEFSKMVAKGKVTKNDDWKAKYKEPAMPDVSGLPDLPTGWCWASIGQLAEQRLGKMLDKNKNTGELRPYIRNANLRWFGFDLTDVAQMRLTDNELESVSIRPGDLAICEGGEPGRCAVWPLGKEKMVIQKAIHRVRPYPGINPHYLAIVLYADALGGRLARSFTGSTIKHFTGTSLRSYLVPIPPAAEQTRIVEFLQRDFSDTDGLIQQVTKNEQRCHRLRHSILNWAFLGKLVNQDPTDEPASILLERIKTEIESLAPNRKSKSQRKIRKA